jgi:hypothetical protein
MRGRFVHPEGDSEEFGDRLGEWTPDGFDLDAARKSFDRP